MTGSVDRARALGLCVLLALPWLAPFSAGPSPSVQQTLFTLALAAAALVVVDKGIGVARSLYLLAVGALVVALLGAKGAWGGLAAAIAAIGAGIAIGAGAASAPSTHRVVPLAWLTAALVSALIGAIQFAGLQGHFSGWISPTASGQVFANLRQRNQLATLLNLGICALAFLSWASDSEEPTRSRQHFTALLGAFSLAAANALTASRTGLLGLALIAIAIWWKASGRHRHVRRLAIAAVLGYVASSFVMRSAPSTASGALARALEVDSGCHSRWTLWSNVWHLVRERPWAGWGWGELDYAHYMASHPGERFCEILDNAHNFPLHVAVELGVPASLTVMASVLWLVLRSRSPRPLTGAEALAWSALVLIGLHSMLEYPLWYAPFQLALGLAVGILLVRHAPGSSTKPAKPPNTLPERMFAIVVLVAVAYAAWDYWRVSQLFLPIPQRAEAYRSKTLEKVASSRLFNEQVRFAELATTPVTFNNASTIRLLAEEMLHFSPEPMVIEKLILSARLLGRAREARLHEELYRRAFPTEYARWPSKSPAP